MCHISKRDGISLGLIDHHSKPLKDARIGTTRTELAEVVFQPVGDAGNVALELLELSIEANRIPGGRILCNGRDGCFSGGFLFGGGSGGGAEGCTGDAWGSKVVSGW